VRSYADLSEHLDQKLNESFREIYDLERILARLHGNAASPRDLLAFAQSVDHAGKIADLMKGMSVKEPLETALRPLQLLAQDLEEVLLSPPPAHAREGQIFQDHADPELQELRELQRNGDQWLLQYEQAERARSGIASLKVRYNRVFGYFIEVTSAHLKSVPSDYERKQTMVGGERFFTPELKAYETKRLTADSRSLKIEQALFQKWCSRILEHSASILELAAQLAEMDLEHGFSGWLRSAGWTMPELENSGRLELQDSRHPLLGHLPSFISNSLSMGEFQGPTQILITGPNMGGKSTFMKQVGLLVILAQVGAPVPARFARIGIVSQILTRMGAHDAIARGQSTFMVEMSELAHTLKACDSRSLLLLDEIGRGTATYDGMSVAWAALEWLITESRARTLFATHYHELTHLPARFPTLGNAHFTAKEVQTSASERKLQFQYRLTPGAASESFGIQVAKLAGLPAPVIRRAWEVLKQLETNEKKPLPLFETHLLETRTEPAEDLVAETKTAVASNSKSSAPWVQEVLDLDLNTLTPLEGLTTLFRLQSQARALLEKSS
jgi:DNA mismatch repair protein MutS